ncbi:40S ribosomal protein S5-1 [Hordeum vulgare]|nr:40S ribosomal protein S5-1 [Hordeum vulgare]
MHEGVLHIHDDEGPKKTGSMEARLEAMEQQVFKCQGMVEHELNANHMMILEFTNKHKIDDNDIGNHLSRLYDRIDHIQAQIYDVQNQNLGHCILVDHYYLATRPCERFSIFVNRPDYIFGMVDTTNYEKVLKTMGLTSQNLVNIQCQDKILGSNE